MGNPFIKGTSAPRLEIEGRLVRSPALVSSPTIKGDRENPPMTGFYAQVVSQKLRDALSKASLSPDGLGEELLLAKVLCARALKAYDISCVNEETAKVASPEQKASAVSNLYDALDFVAKMQRSAAQISMMTEKIGSDASQLFSLVGNILESELRDNPDILHRIAARVAGIERNMRRSDIVISIT